jgi:hypothetical protein
MRRVCCFVLCVCVWIRTMIKTTDKRLDKEKINKQNDVQGNDCSPTGC